MHSGNSRIRILHLEDREEDAEEIAWILKKDSGELYDIKVVDNREQFESALVEFSPDLVISDHNLPSFNSIEALQFLKSSRLRIPFILVTGTVSEEFAVEAMRTGADDYVLKDRMHRLPNAIAAALEKYKRNQEQQANEMKIRESEEKFRAFFENSMDGILLSAIDGEIISANPAACEMLQMTEAEICAVSRFDLIDPADLRLKDLQEARKRHGHCKGELIFIRKGGDKFPGELTLSVFKGPFGKDMISVIFRDITDRKMAEEKLLATSAALQKALRDISKIMDSSMDMICSMDENGKFLQVNAASETVLGYKADELLGKSVFDLIKPDHLLNTRETAGRVMEGQLVTNFENSLIKKDGSTVPLVWSARWDAVEKIQYGVARDATEMKQAERRIVAERKRLSDLFMNAPVSICVLKGPDHIIELANPTFLRITGREHLEGKSYREAFPELEDQGMLKLMDHVFKTGDPLSINEMMLKIDREQNGELAEVYQDILQQPYRDAEGRVEGIFYFGVDVTDQVRSRQRIEEAEQRYRQIVETAQEGIWVIDENENTVFVNGKLSELLECPRKELVGRNIAEFMSREEIGVGRELMKGTTDGNASRGDFKFVSKTGRELWTSISANPLFNEFGTYKGSLAMITDITERKRSETETLRLVEKLQRHNKDLQQFSYIVSHNLRAPISKILGLTSIVEPENDENRMVIEKISEETTNLDGIVRDINTIVSARKLDRERMESVSFQSELNLVLHILETEITESNADVRRNFSVEEIFAIKSYIHSILYNLVSNAIKYRHPARKPEIIIDTILSDDFIRLTVKDNGLGIDLSRYENKLFGLYKRFHGNTAPGKGVGLSLVKTHVESLGGKIEVESSPDAGTKFSIYLPNEYGKNDVD